LRAIKLLFVFMFVFLLTGCGNSANNAKIESTPSVATHTSYVVSSEVEKNPLMAKEKYNNKVITVITKPEYIGKSLNDEFPYEVWELKGIKSNVYVRFFFTDKQKDSITKLNAGKSVEIKGLVTRVDANYVDLIGCVVTKNN